MNANFLGNLHANMEMLKSKMPVLREQAERTDDASYALWKRVQELEADKLATDEELDRAYNEYAEAYEAHAEARDCYDSCEKMLDLLIEVATELAQATEWHGLNLGE
jgi:chromosome segregation ATPase